MENISQTSSLSADTSTLPFTTLNPVIIHNLPGLWKVFKCNSEGNELGFNSAFFVDFKETNIMIKKF
jgi:hypothetical protein